MLKVDKTGVEDARFRAETVWVIWDIYDKEMGVFFAKRKKRRNKKYIRRGEEYQPTDPESVNSHTQGVYYMVYNITPGSLEYYQVVYAYMRP